jgi:hypothetical protein
VPALSEFTRLEAAYNHYSAMPDLTPPLLRDRIRQVLLDDWDPCNAARFEAARHEYDGYLSPLADLIRSDADEDTVVLFLKDRESEILCFPAIGTSHLKRVARKLIALRES